MSELKLQIQKRSNKGKNENKNIRKQKKIPVNILTMGESILGSLKLDDFQEILKKNIQKSTIINVSLEGQDEFPVFIKEIQRWPHTDEIIHLDFYKPKKDRAFILEIGIEVLGSPAGVKKGGQFVHLIRQLKVKTFLKDVQETIQVDVSNLDVGEIIKVSDLKLNKNWDILIDEQAIVLGVNKTKALIAKEKKE